MKRCESCGYQVDDDVLVCAHCGSETFENTCGRCGTSYVGKRCPSCKLRCDERPTICPSCTNRTYEKVCPECGQALRGWEYQKAIAVTRAAYGRMYSGRGGGSPRKSVQAKHILLVMATFLAAPVGLMWLVVFHRRLRPAWKIITGVYVFFWGLSTIYLQLAMNGAHRWLSILAAFLLCVVPGIWGLAKGISGVRKM